MINSQITTSPAHGHDAAEGSSTAEREIGTCAACGRSMLPASISRHFRTACKGNPNIQWHRCPQCPNEFTRKDALRRHLIAPQACPGSRRATTSPSTAMGPGPSRTTRTRIARRVTPYIPSPASSSGSSSVPSRHRYSSSSNTITPATSASPPVIPSIDFDPPEECHGGAPLPVMNCGASNGGHQIFSQLLGTAASPFCMDQYSRHFEQPRAPSLPADQFGHYSHVPQPALLSTYSEVYGSNDAPLEVAPSTDFRSNWDHPVLQPHGDSWLEFLSTSAASVPANVDTGYPQPATSSQHLALDGLYPAAMHEPSAFDFLEPAFPEADHLGEQVEFDAQYSSGDAQDPRFPDGFPRLSTMEPQSLWELGASAAAPNGDFGGLGTDIFDYIVY